MCSIYRCEDSKNFRYKNICNFVFEEKRPCLLIFPDKKLDTKNKNYSMKFLLFYICMKSDYVSQSCISHSCKSVCRLDMTWMAQILVVHMCSIFFVLHHIQGTVSWDFFTQDIFYESIFLRTLWLSTWRNFFENSRRCVTSCLPIVILTPAVNCSPVLLTQMNNNGCRTVGKKSSNGPQINLTATCQKHRTWTN